MTASTPRETRLLVYMSKAQRKGLKALAKRTGTSQQELIRRGIDLVLKVRS
jgi:ribbon-helix-helix protein